MALHLPSPFQAKMKTLLGTNYDNFMKSYEQLPHAGLRVNTLKISTDAFRDLSPFELEPIPWCPTGYYTQEGERPGRHPYYHAGLYYIQEPSAMAPVELLDVTPGDLVLDLCAAPGGKSTQIAAKLQGEGLLVSNDLHPDRTKALAKNLEMYGVRNAVVLNDDPERIAGAFPEFFTKILIDAPCSGEGMFRKDESMLKYWDESSPLKFAEMQQEILDAAARMLRPGGRMVYSTCTFSPEENEAMIARFLLDHRDYEVLPIDRTHGFSPGETGWLAEQEGTDAELLQQVAGTARLWPHRVRGEGHFMAVLQRKGELTVTEDEMKTSLEMVAEPEATRPGKRGRAERPGKAQRSGTKHTPAESAAPSFQPFLEFIETHLQVKLCGYSVIYGNHIYVSPLPESRLKQLKVVRPGWYMGQLKNGRFVPGHPLATALHPHECVRCVNLSSEDGEAVRYLKGETLSITEERVRRGGDAERKGYVLVCIDGYSAGWGKWQSGMLKNEYPAGWRWTSV
ncbi:16S rRNA (cytosine(1407)-C(5))-methyltransferase RsmF [Paenibacillus sp. JCM 10914]|uniref:RsmB/NOP family class I SAM-dependent RNA methyltransferase n=1 Tax=Paenibacillus sp. JCM 10914 TaxID=1236974 RepID=UPI0003CCBC41|nr:RsmB/NOP family class I SAM-dependent RNA methyltransferase [Paenibacillus sp. JCM 10914]GAE07950.1 tRNA and rRNA cytosine-C5-methylases [Paenibacillus sp. JCM 10914]